MSSSAHTYCYIADICMKKNTIYWTSIFLFTLMSVFCHVRRVQKLLKQDAGGWRCVKHVLYALTDLTLRGTVEAKRKTPISIFSSSSFWVDLLQRSSVGFPDAGLSCRPAPPFNKPHLVQTEGTTCVHKWKHGGIRGLFYDDDEVLSSCSIRYAALWGIHVWKRRHIF